MKTWYNDSFSLIETGNFVQCFCCYVEERYLLYKNDRHLIHSLCMSTISVNLLHISLFRVISGLESLSDLLVHLNTSETVLILGILNLEGLQTFTGVF